MLDALLTFSIAGWLLPFIVEVACRGARPISDAIARAAIGSIAAYLLIIHVIAIFEVSSRLTFTLAAFFVGVIWLVFRMQPFVESIVTFEFSKNWIRIFGPILFVGVAATAVLIQPHFLYSGFLITSTGVKEVANEKILTPYFSDEWASVAFVDQAITTGGLPTRHPFAERSSYVSYMTPYFMGLTAFFSTFALDPIFQFAFAPLALGLALVYAAYVCARSFGASRVASATAALTIPFIANSANLAGIWYAIPAHAGLLSMVFTLSLQQDSVRWRVMGYVLSMFLYPPIIAFIIPIALITERRRLSLKILGATVVTGIVAILVPALSPNVSVVHSFKNALQLMVRPLGLDFAGDIPLYSPYVVIPLAALVGCGIAVPILAKKFYTIGVGIVVGCIGWVMYSIISVTVVIDVQRVVFITSVLVCIAAALGYDRIIAWVRKKISFNPTAAVWVVLVLVLSHVTPLYSADDAWREFVLPTPKRGEGTFLFPAPPASKYLIQEDLDLLRRFDVVASSAPRTFITTPWKGLVLGTATRHAPLHTKASIVGTAYLRYEQFIEADCEQLEAYRAKFSIDFAYVPKLPTCPSVVPVATSTEGFVLYEMRGQ